MILLHEVFPSIQGEGLDTGLPTIFVRLFGCNVRCSYCDQPQTKEDKHKISFDGLMQLIKLYPGINRVCITGGEPLLQPEIYTVVYSLVDQGYKVSIETNGCIPIEPDHYRRSYKYVMDVKCPSSGVSSKNEFMNLTYLHTNDEVKFVVANRKDYDYAKGVMKKYPTMAKILFSPMFTPDKKMTIGQDLVRWILEDKLSDVRVQIQMHKIIGVM